MGVVAAAPRTAAGRVPALGGAAVVSAGVAAACGRRVVELVGSVASVGPDELVELAVLTIGALVLAWLAGSAATAAVCLLVRRVGGVWRHGESWVQRCAPALVRRALVVAVAAGLGAASVTTASAADLSPTTGPSTASVATGGAGPDLGWVVTATSPAPSLPPAGSAAATRGPAPTSDPGRRTPVETPPRSASADERSAGAAHAPTADPPGTTSAAPAPSAAVPATTTAAPARSADMPGTTSVAPAPEAVMTTPFDPCWAPSVGSATSGSGADALAVPGAARWTSGDGASAGREAATVVVVRGDTLWGIAARHLPADAGETEVAAAWPAWYAANAATIGPDPGLILPGQVLVPPPVVTR